MKVPPPKVRADLADDWHTISMHEAGHIVASEALGLPLYEATLSYRKHGLLSPTWTVISHTWFGAPNSTIKGTDDEGLLFALSGLEAESMWISSRDRVPLERARRSVSGRPFNLRHAGTEISACLLGSTISYAQAEQWCNDLLRRNWLGVERIASELRTHGRLSAGQVRRLARVVPAQALKGEK